MLSETHKINGLQVRPFYLTIMDTVLGFFGTIADTTNE